MSAQYWIAKYVDDPFRNEPRNVGVIVEANGSLVARFFGEREDGVFDARKIKSKFLYPNVYSQWRDFWRDRIKSRDLTGIIKGKTANFYVDAGGDVTDTGSDNSGEVCHFLYTLLVGAGAMEAFDWKDTEDSEVDLAEDITVALKEFDVLATSADLLEVGRHPVVRNRDILGSHVTHTPSFSQQNGRLYVFEHINLSSMHINKAKERAGWMAYMFEDIRSAHKEAQAYSLVRPEKEDGVEQIEYAKTMLRGESKVINWSDENERQGFLQERKQVAA
ncbi:hypothetical protein [Bradyrhizobium sp. 62]|uniref:hypothetical protein n=1 Tax=Bradyrhizobium sp. 62 TaxID=1043588 RepID=UPI001FF81B57|nr:hypothetical protein [Bradyrhizobium sp. 62]MCK1366407.1 hypothetical protein [Bradyrhizobium sp. 62]